ncbi:type IV secretion system protein VirB10 [Mesosutterella sp. AGMB02718]|uniref:Type IV secretion system protein VirB10 n=1 Tax=Mesosutterella faecium TaxID=2925194 RepID=A0ABT7INT8_9BURK|nr:type IV secretion system protein VirB10 [Mesosutterella sp. AGMB02718]MDL2060039.1 type IV secretion system protein VirB10 [Mesosutterella sp. AGMB02718]
MKAEDEKAGKPLPDQAGVTHLDARAKNLRAAAAAAAAVAVLGAAAGLVFWKWAGRSGAAAQGPSSGAGTGALETSSRTLKLEPLPESALAPGRNARVKPASSPAAETPPSGEKPAQRAPAHASVPAPLRVPSIRGAAEREASEAGPRFTDPLEAGRGQAPGGAAAPALRPGGKTASAAAPRDDDARLQATAAPGAKAGLVRGRSLRIARGTAIECLLTTRIDTTVPGPAACVIPRDVYSKDGRTLLLEKGSKAFGEYRGAVQHGLARIFLLWTRIETPRGVAVNLNSPAADALGGAGLDGTVDRHWWERFGSALLFSLVSDAFDFGVARETDANGGVNYYANTSESMSGLIAEAMRHAGDIPPTLTRAQGTRLTIIAARDLDFSGVYAAAGPRP